jgi:CBS-domain-containing membrane protein
VTSLSTTAQADPARAEDSRTADPCHNPSYPPRVHFLEAADLEKALRSCDERLNAAYQKLRAIANHAQQPLLVRLYHQLQGARDQIAEAVRRLPLETADLYHEDKERFEQAQEAFERTWAIWEKTAV